MKYNVTKASASDAREAILVAGMSRHAGTALRAVAMVVGVSLVVFSWLRTHRELGGPVWIIVMVIGIGLTAGGLFGPKGSEWYTVAVRAGGVLLRDEDARVAQFIHIPWEFVGNVESVDVQWNVRAICIELRYAGMSDADRDIVDQCSYTRVDHAGERAEIVVATGLKTEKKSIEILERWRPSI